MSHDEGIRYRQAHEENENTGDFNENHQGKEKSKRKRYFSESAYATYSQRYISTAIWDSTILILNFFVVLFVLILMGLLQYFLSISEDKISRSESQILRIRRGRENFYKLIPTRLVSRLWGWVHDKRLVYGARSFIFKVYSKIYHVNISEAADPNLSNYQNLGQFFRRELKKGARPISPAKIISPCDGKIMVQGKVKDGIIRQVKGTSFTLSQFLGPPMDLTTTQLQGAKKYMYKADDPDNRRRYCQRLLRNPTANCMYYSVIYLAPGDYHRFHSPVTWKVTLRRHFPGELYSVNPSITSWFDNLFVLNERVCLIGEWMHGFFSFTAVGATMVGSIKLPWDTELKTNQRTFDRKQKEYFDRCCSKEFEKGEEIGEFNLGSTVVLAFEAPKGLCFKFRDHDSVRLGLSLSTHIRVQSMPNLLLHLKDVRDTKRNLARRSLLPSSSIKNLN